MYTCIHIHQRPQQRSTYLPSRGRYSTMYSELNAQCRSKLQKYKAGANKINTSLWSVDSEGLPLPSFMHSKMLENKRDHPSQRTGNKPRATYILMMRPPHYFLLGKQCYAKHRKGTRK